MNHVEVTRARLERVMRENVNLAQLDRLVIEIADLVTAKNHDYGDAWQRFGIFTPLIRMNDKLLRVMTLASGQTALVADERIQDTLRDIVGYAILALLWIAEQDPTGLELSVDAEIKLAALERSTATVIHVPDTLPAEQVDELVRRWAASWQLFPDVPDNITIPDDWVHMTHTDLSNEPLLDNNKETDQQLGVEPKDGEDA